MRPRNIVFCVIFFAAAAVAFSASSASAWLPEKYGGAITLRLHSKMSRIDPILATRPDEFTVIFAVFEPLLYRNPGGGVSPLLLEQMPEKSEDGLTYRFMLKEDIAFHDGTTLDTADVLFSFQRLVKSNRSAYSWILDGIKGTTNFRTGRARDIEGFKIIDARSFEITLVKPNPNFLRLLSFPASCIVSNTNSSFNPPIGSGPFKFTSMKANGAISLGFFSDHAGGRPYLDSVKFVVVKNDDDAVVEFRTSGLSITDTPPDGLRSEDKSGGASIVTGNMKTFYILDINASRRALSDAGDRAALSASIDRKAIAKVIMNGLGQPESNVRGKSAHGKTQPKSSGEKPKTKKLTLWYPDTGKAMKFLAQKILHDAAAAGFDITLEKKSLAELLSYSEKGAPDLILRTISVPQDAPDALDRILRNGSYISAFSSVTFRAGADSIREFASQHALYLTLLSQKCYYLNRHKFQNMTVGAFNQIELSGITINTEIK